MAGEWPPPPFLGGTGGENGRRMAGEWPENGWRMVWGGGRFRREVRWVLAGVRGNWGGIWRSAALNRRICNNRWGMAGHCQRTHGM
eukprot:9622693-Alexandrium_andersonii.AAC.1